MITGLQHNIIMLHHRSGGHCWRAHVQERICVVRTVVPQQVACISSIVLVTKANILFLKTGFIIK